jgi:hypothetical protein
VVARHEPLLEQFTVTDWSGATEWRTATRARSAGNRLGLPYRIKVHPATGHLLLRGLTRSDDLSDTDLDELERFSGRAAGGAGQSDQRTTVGRGARLMLRLAGLPSLKLTGRSDRFEVR